MKVYDAADLSGPDDWSGPTITGIGNAVAKLRWINSPSAGTGIPELNYSWSGPEAEPEMVHLRAGQLLLIEDGEEHVAHPQGEARILVVEQEDSE